VDPHPFTVRLRAGGTAQVTDFGGPADAPALVLVHGLASSAVAWTTLARTLVSTHRVLAVDLPGHGRTPAGRHPFSMHDAATLLEEVLDACGLHRVTLVGHSMGAAVCVLMAAQAPTRVEQMLLLAPPLPRRRLPGVGVAVLPQIALCLWPTMGLRILRRRLSGRSLDELVAERLRLARVDGEDLARLTAAMAADLRAALERGEDPLRVFIDAARSVGLLVTLGREYRAAVAAIRVPVRVVHGANDPVLRVSEVRQLQTLQPDWQLHVLPGVGHSPHLETPMTVARLVVGGVKVIDAAPAGTRRRLSVLPPSRAQSGLRRRTPEPA
jgi:pimeloyl-ACP methyl ester carboxylesterase